MTADALKNGSEDQFAGKAQHPAFYVVTFVNELRHAHFPSCQRISRRL